jgi:type I restriction enzyme S subunit
MSSEPKSVGRVSPIGRNPTDRSQVSVSEHENVGLRCANPTYGDKWRDTTWGDIVTLEYGKSIRDYQNASGTVPVYGTNGPIGWHHTPLYPSAGVIIGRKGAYRGIHYSNKPFFVIDTAFYLKPKERLDTKWAYYCLLTYDINGMDSGSAIPSTSRDEFYKLPVRLPDFSEQQQIAKLLSSFDDRIALLRETNATLEAIAQALFKSWFVDFDPVHAKQQDRAPEGMDETTAALFPDSFEESELGLVPKGWRVGTLADITSVKGGFAYKSEAFGEQGSPVIKIKNIVGDGTVNLLDTQYIALEMAEKTIKFALKDGDIVIAMTGATIGKTGVIVTNGDQVPYLNQRVAKFEPNLFGHNNNWFVYIAFQNSFIFDQVVNAASGSAQPNISASGIESVRLVIPSSHDLLSVFNEIASPLFSGWIANLKQAQTLANLRDTLLPRLISGQLRLPDDNTSHE